MSNTERRQIKVVSFDNDKVEIHHLEDGSSVVFKKTNATEIFNMSQMKNQLFSGKRSSLMWRGITFTVSVPEVISWESSSGILTTKLFVGENLELPLRSEDCETREKFVDLAKVFIDWMRRTGTIWGDAAPRNIVVNEETKEICIFDFEKGSLLQEQSFSEEEFNLIIRGIICEEFCAFLFPEEQKEVFGDIWVSQDILISQKYLRGKRERILYEIFFGNLKDQISLKNAISVQKLMVETVTPFLTSDGEPFFPLIHLAESKSPEEYVNLLLELTSLDRSVWQDFLTQRES